jgi:hypothetical protein
MDWKSCEVDGYPTNDNAEVLFITKTGALMSGYFSDHSSPAHFRDRSDTFSLDEVLYWIDFDKIPRPNLSRITDDRCVQFLLKGK